MQVLNKNGRSELGSALDGIWSGILATGPMTLLFFRFFDSLPEVQSKALPPATLTKELLKTVGAAHQLGSRGLGHFTMASHYGFGAFTGWIYSKLLGRVQMPGVLKGTLFGLGVWSLSYLGWIPALGLRPSAHKMNQQRNLMMIIAHLVWGASLGYAEEELRKSGKQMLVASGKRAA